jgi:cyclopropane-fatty-acyl-phospholipid synthase
MSKHETTVSDDENAGTFATAAEPGLVARTLRRRIFERLALIGNGRLTITDALGTQDFGGGSGPEAQVRVRDFSTYGDIARGGTIGAAEAYMRGKWVASDLTSLVRIFVANRPMMEGLDGDATWLVMPVLRLVHWLRRNTPRQSRRNIRAHYDLGNDFYRLFLDSTLSYSAGIYPRPDSSLEEAAVHKLDVICRKLELRPGEELLEIGTGWGGLAIHAARHYGCRVTTTTISAKQRDYARQRVREAGLQERITVLDRDYRDLRGQYDKLVSVEMIEAVGLNFLDAYFRVCAERLRPHGRMLLQGIVIADRIFGRAQRSVDFIQKYIFPGGALPSLAAIRASVARASDLRPAGLQDIGQDYARTLREWRRRFMAQLPAVRQLGFSDEFIRMWEYYLAYCEGGFLERAITDVQLVLDKPGCRLSPALDATLR